METVQPEAVSANTHPGLKTDGQASKEQTGDMFEDDLELQEQARQAKLKREQEEKAAKAAAKEEERKRKERERAEKDARKKAAGPSWIQRDRKSTRLNSSHANISYAVFCLKK